MRYLLPFCLSAFPIVSLADDDGEARSAFTLAVSRSKPPVITEERTTNSQKNNSLRCQDENCACGCRNGHKCTCGISPREDMQFVGNSGIYYCASDGRYYYYRTKTNSQQPRQNYQNVNYSNGYSYSYGIPASYGNSVYNYSAGSCVGGS